MAQDFKETLNLPKTNFPMRANLAAREPERFKHWEASGLYEAILRQKAGCPSYILHDGPPYANGDIHCGHALNKILKDIIIRYKTMRGYRVPYVPGWDCHGLPIEQQVLKKIGAKIHDMSPVELRRECHQYAAKYIDIQREQFKRLGVMGDWARPYTTFDPNFEAGILSCLRDLVAKGLVYKDFKTVHWDPVFRTALAEAEIEYHKHVSNSIYFLFPLRQPEKYPALQGLKNVSFAVWTTTPWTLPANLGVCLHPNYDYVAITHGDRTYIAAEGLAQSFISACDLKDTKVVARFKATEFERGECDHPIFPEKSSLIMLGEMVTLEQGTGCVHTAPGHGADDFELGRSYGLPVVVPVDDKGCFTAEYPAMRGVFVFDANDKIIEFLSHQGILLKHGKIEHDYPYSWRSKKPIIFRATEQWFMDLAGHGIREKALEAIEHDVRWIPEWGRERIRGMVERRPAWCLSRQRAWGVPIPSIRSKKTGRSILDARLIDKFISAVRTRGTNCWFTEPLEKFLPEGFVYEPTGESQPSDFEKEFNTLDVWFDSGSSHIACVEQDDRLAKPPVDLYLEGSDQHRGWFQSSLLTSIGARGVAPYKTVLTHGFVLDGQGLAMSKSGGNVISPLQLMDKYGADILRLWVASEDYRNDVGISVEIMENIARSYRDIRNTLRFLLGNVSDFDPARDAVPPAQLPLVDQWALHQTAVLIDEVTKVYENFEFHRVYQLCNNFCVGTLSATYHDLLKDRLYTWRADSSGRRAAQTVLHNILDTLTRLLAPILVFTADEAHAYAQSDRDFTEKSIHLTDWPAPAPDWLNADAAFNVDQILQVRGKVNEKLEALRQAKTIGQSLEAAVTITGSPTDPVLVLLHSQAAALPEIFIVSQVVLHPDAECREISIEAAHAGGRPLPALLALGGNLGGETGGCGSSALRGSPINLKIFNQSIMSAKKKTANKPVAAPSKAKTAAKKTAPAPLPRKKTDVKKPLGKKPAPPEAASNKAVYQKPAAKSPPVNKKTPTAADIAAPEKLSPEAMKILSKRPKHTPAVFKLPTRKHTPIVFTLEEVREVIKNKKNDLGGDITKVAAVKKVEAKIPEPGKKHAVVHPSKTTGKQRMVGAASLAEILGFNPKAASKQKNPAEQEPPRKWARYYKKLVDLRNHLGTVLSEHAQDTLKRSSKEDSGDLSSYGQHIADAGTDTFDRDFALSLLSSEQDAMFEIQAAIDRIFDGTYGTCEITGKPISKERLEAVPFTRYSLEGQAEYERTKRRQSDRSGTFLEATADVAIPLNDEETEE